jgi:polysaccharide export outer membrane protein
MYRNLKISVFLLLCSISTAAVFAQTAPNTPVLEPPKTEAHYIIAPNDVLQIFVYKEPNLSGKVTVLPDGRISFPLVQDMQAAGLNPAQLKAKIEEALKEYIDVPTVTVQVESIQSYRVYVEGKVAKSGMISSEKPITVLQAISIAGGFAEFADPAEMVIIRGGGEDSKLFRFNYPEVIKGKNFSQNMLLRPGDVVVVP